MTTRIHIVNFGPDIVDVEAYNPETGEKNVHSEVPSIASQQSVDIYVHGTQSVRVTERKTTT